MILSALAPPLCAACGAWAARTEPLCPDCRAGLRWLPPEPVFCGALALWAPVAYAGPARALVRGLKFGGVTRAAVAMAAQIAANAPPALLDADVLAPVPLHPARLRRRGFNQAARIAAELGRRASLPVWDGLERAGPAGTQVGRGRAERLAGIAGTLAVRAGAEVPRSVVIVDDVVTTGATLSACAAALRAAGARRMTAVAYARTPGR
ncbi:MAG: double zinc ribbon domain-containing protein [Thermoleophilaceae bacterium]